MSEEKPAEKDAGTEAETPKKPGLLSKLMKHKSYILHSLFVFLLFGFFIWQILDFYQLSTGYNRGRAVKTHHMIVFDIETGKYLTNVPRNAAKEEEEAANDAHQTAAEQPVHEDAPPPEVTVILTGLGKDPAYTSDVTTLPPEFVFSYSPYGSKPLETSKYKASEGATVISEVAYADGKFDISNKNTDFRNTSNVEAAISKIFGASAVYVAAPDTYISSADFTKLAADMEHENILVVVPSAYKGANSNVVLADVLVKAVTSPPEIKVALEKLEEAAKADGYAVMVIEPQPGVGAVLKEWVATLEAKKIKLTPAIKN